MKLPTKKRMREACEQKGTPYFVYIAIANRDGDWMVCVDGPAGTPFSKRLARLMMFPALQRMRECP